MNPTAITLQKNAAGEYNVSLGNQPVGVARVNHTGLYEVELPGGIKILAINQRKLKDLVVKALTL
jgi:hypothetical protein